MTEELEIRCLDSFGEKGGRSFMAYCYMGRIPQDK